MDAALRAGNGTVTDLSTIGDANLAGRIASYELAGRMQTSVPDVMDLSSETDRTLKEYGVEGGSELRGEYAKNCLLARRLIEQGVRVVQLFNGSDPSGGNMDMNNYHGRYRGERLLAKIDGPGCIYRIWSAMPTGSFKVYLDGSTEAEIKCKYKQYLEGKCEGLPGDFAVGRAANYMPIPFEKSVIVTAPFFT